VVTGELSCLQISPAQLKKPPGGKNPLGDEHTPFIKQTEDCLFLDMYVPAVAFEYGPRLLPVTVWIYGGAYAYGSKSQFGPLYTGQSLITASNYQVCDDREPLYCSVQSLKSLVSQDPS